jgi:hypothetical protein
MERCGLVGTVVGRKRALGDGRPFSFGLSFEAVLDPDQSGRSGLG